VGGVLLKKGEEEPSPRMRESREATLPRAEKKNGIDSRDGDRQMDWMNRPRGKSSRGGNSRFVLRRKGVFVSWLCRRCVQVGKEMRGAKGGGTR